MKHTGSWTIRIVRTIVHASCALIYLRARARCHESSLYDFVRIIPKLGRGAGLSAEALASSVARDCNPPDRLYQISMQASRRLVS